MLWPQTEREGEHRNGSSPHLLSPAADGHTRQFPEEQSDPAPETNLLHSTEGLEYEIIQAIATATADTVHTVAFIEGHGELDEIFVADLTLELAKFYNIDRGVIGGRRG
jgi:hypothetical protein